MFVNLKKWHLIIFFKRILEFQLEKILQFFYTLLWGKKLLYYTLFSLEYSHWK